MIPFSLSGADQDPQVQSVKRDLVSVKRDLVSVKRDLVSALSLSLVQIKTLKFNLSKET